MTSSDSAYEANARRELAEWRARLSQPPGPMDAAAKHMQATVNRLIPEKVHVALTKAVETLTRGIVTGADWLTAEPLQGVSLQEREQRIATASEAWRIAAAAEGGMTGAAGILGSAADFPALLALKFKLLVETAAYYGHDAKDWRERLYILWVFQLAFSSGASRIEQLDRLAAWDQNRAALPAGPEDFDWRRFQQEYRDHIDLAKLAQMLPVVGAPVGALVNFNLMQKLSETAKGAYRMRWFARPQ
jgi:hypothetical protein